MVLVSIQLRRALLAALAVFLVACCAQIARPATAPALSYVFCDYVTIDCSDPYGSVPRTWDEGHNIFLFGGVCVRMTTNGVPRGNTNKCGNSVVKLRRRTQ